MHLAGHARFLLALMAAIALHALLFTLPSSSTLPTLHLPAGSLAVELLKAQESEQNIEQRSGKIPAVHKKAVLVLEKSRAELQKKLNTKHKKIIATQHFKAKALPADVRSARIPEEAGKPGGTTVKAVPSAAHSVHRGVNVVPDRVQKNIFTYVRYPRLARRRGWEGRAEFQLNVRKQAIQNIVLLASSGHHILDKAAKHGIEKARHIPLSDGNYLLPVEFHLQ